MSDANPILELNQYTQDQLNEVERFSQAFQLYRTWVSSPRSNDDIRLALRWDRHQAWLKAAAATYFEKASTAQIGLFWSQAVDQILLQAWDVSGLSSLPVALVALGKLGSEELNLSSDVDLMVISQPGATIEIERALKRFRYLLAENTELGFALRLDFDLRPGGRLGPLISSLAQVEDYYWSQGETWERLALVRARILQGSPDFCRAITEVFQRFSFRRFLDYTLLDDLKHLRGRMRQFHANWDKDEFNLKLGRGGIRDIELFVHALQVIHGGRDLSLRTRSTSEALLLLAKKKILPEEEARLLDSTYWWFRHLEHLVQLTSDRQTHSWNFISPPLKGKALDQQVLLQRAERIDQTVKTLLGEIENFTFTLPDTFEQQKDWLIQLGFSESLVDSVWQELLTYTARSKKLARDESARQHFLYEFVMEVSRSGLDKELALSLLLEFTQAIRAKATFFSLFAYEPRLVRDLAHLFSASPYLGQILASRPELIDSFLFRAHETFSSDLETSLDEMAEYRLLTELVAANQFLVEQNILVVGRQLSVCADYICSELMSQLDDRVEPNRLSIVALGKWGGLELGFRSDLDLVFLSMQEPRAEDQKIARRFIHRLTDLHKGGRIYSIDLRLRPSGQAGPLIVRQSALEEYLGTQALVWERQAYLRSRSIYGDKLDLVQRCCERGVNDQELLELKRIREKLLVPSFSSGSVDLKLSRGGLVDIELGIQTRLLFEKIIPQGPSTGEMIEALRLKSGLDPDSATNIYKNYLELRTFEQMVQLTFNHSGSHLPQTGSEVRRLSHLLGFSPEGMHERLETLLSQNIEILNGLDPIYCES